ncbi:MAG: hypothetical protein H6925_07160 [Holosporaceae bacterium]|nr:MAG: hypothetical protein H6925_07160 [Holosporaceae bacterium]
MVTRTNDFPNSAFSRPILKENLDDFCLSYGVFEAHNLSMGRGEMVVVNNSMDAKEASLLMGHSFYSTYLLMRALCAIRHCLG